MPRTCSRRNGPTRRCALSWGFRPAAAPTRWQQVIVETKAGVAGVLAAEYTAQQPADGSALLMVHINSHGLAPSLQPKLRYNLRR